MDVEKLTEAVARAICCPSGVCWSEHCGAECEAPKKKRYEAAAAIRAVLDGIDTTDAAMVERMLDAYWGQADTNDAPMDHAPMRAAATAMIDHLKERLDD